MVSYVNTGEVLDEIFAERKRNRELAAKLGVDKVRLKYGTVPGSIRKAGELAMNALTAPSWTNVTLAGAAIVAVQDTDEGLRKALIRLAEAAVAWIEDIDSKAKEDANA